MRTNETNEKNDNPKKFLVWEMFCRLLHCSKKKKTMNEK